VASLKIERRYTVVPGFHGFDLIIILVIALLIFGPKKLPEVGSAIGKSIKEYRKSMKEIASPQEEEETPPAVKSQAQEPEHISAQAVNESENVS
jgi:sec-independent protein translocase protein TatA